jgi:hypothetical protein
MQSLDAYTVQVYQFQLGYNTFATHSQIWVYTIIDFAQKIHHMY